jgi:hypothetical protein
VNRTIDAELRAAFQEASEFVHPGPGLADKARGGARRRQRKLAGAIAATTSVLLVAAVSAYLLAGLRPPAPGPSQHHRHVQSGPIYLKALPAYYQVQRLAASGSYLYVLTHAPDTLSAYDLATGRLIHVVTVPAMPVALAVGPGGRVWLASTPSGGNTGGVWLLSPDLRSRSEDGGIQTNIVLPVSPVTAFVPSQYGLVTVRMPAPGLPGRASERLVPGTSLGPSMNTSPDAWAGVLDGAVVVQATDGHGFTSHVVVAGRPSLRFGGSLRQQIGGVTSTGSVLWAATYALNNGNASSWGPLVRLDGQLRATTPVSVRTSPVLAKAENVWSDGDTVWVATAASRHSLVCFVSAGSRMGPVVTVPVSGQVVALAASKATVYVSTDRSQTNGPWAVSSYPVPIGCR